MSLQSIMQKVGGFRGLAAGAAIAWGTAQAQAIASQTQDEAQAAQEALQSTLLILAERSAELDKVHSEYDALCESMRKEARSYVLQDVRAGKYDVTVGGRAMELGWTPPYVPEPAPDLPTVETAGPYPKPYAAGVNPLPSVGDPAAGNIDG